MNEIDLVLFLDRGLESGIDSFSIGSGVIEGSSCVSSTSCSSGMEVEEVGELLLLLLLVFEISLVEVVELLLWL